MTERIRSHMRLIRLAASKKMPILKTMW